MKKTNKISDIDQLIDVISPSDSLKDIVRLMLNHLFPRNPSVVEKAYSLFINEENSKSLRDITKAVYIKHYTASEIKKMLGFYKTKDGQTILNKMPAAAAEMAGASREWALKIMENAKGKIEEIIEEQIKFDENSRAEEIRESERIVQARYNFSRKYIAEKKWDKRSLSVEQIMEIRSQEGWKNP